MKNPYYKPPADVPDPEYEHAGALAALERYLTLSEAYEEIPDTKLRKVHADLADDDVWDDVVANLGKRVPSAPKPAAGRKKGRR